MEVRVLVERVDRNFQKKAGAFLSDGWKVENYVPVMGVGSSVEHCAMFTRAARPASGPTGAGAGADPEETAGGSRLHKETRRTKGRRGNRKGSKLGKLATRRR